MNILKTVLVLVIVTSVGVYGISLNNSENKVLAEQIEVTPTLEPSPTLMPEPTPIPTIEPSITPTLVPTKIPTPTVTPGPSPTPSATPSPTPIPIVLAPADLEPLFNEFAAKYNVSSNLLKKIAQCESHFNTGVVSRNGLYAGMFQFTTGTWISNRNAMGANPDLGLRHGARESIETAAYVLAHAGPKAWPACSK